MRQEVVKDPFAPQELTSREDVGLLMEGDFIRVFKFGREVKAVVGSGSTDERKVLLWRAVGGCVYRASVPVQYAFVDRCGLNLEMLAVEIYNRFNATGDDVMRYREISAELERFGSREAGGLY